MHLFLQSSSLVNMRKLFIEIIAKACSKIAQEHIEKKHSATASYEKKKNVSTAVIGLIQYVVQFQWPEQLIFCCYATYTCSIYQFYKFIALTFKKKKLLIWKMGKNLTYASNEKENGS